MINKNPKLDGRSLFALVFESVMAVLYICIAFLLLKTQVLDAIIAENFRLPLGLILALYGLFRIYRAIKRIKSVKDEDQ